MRHILTIGALIAATVLPGGIVLAGSTPVEKCQSGKSLAAGRYAACRQTAEGKLAAAGGASNTDALTKYNAAIGKCTTTFSGAWMKLEAAAAAKHATCLDGTGTGTQFKTVIDEASGTITTALEGAPLADCPAELTTAQNCGNGVIDTGESCDQSDLGGANCASATAGSASFGKLACAHNCTFDTSGCQTGRFVNNLDGTLTDQTTGLMWELKNGNPADSADDCSLDPCPNPHFVYNLYRWTLNSGGSAPDGSLFTNFLARLNGTWCSTYPCTPFNGHSDWRLPTNAELNTIVDLSAAGCGGGTNPCIDPAFGLNAGGGGPYYWSSETDPGNSTAAFAVYFANGNTVPADKWNRIFVRAVRGPL